MDGDDHRSAHAGAGGALALGVVVRAEPLADHVSQRALAMQGVTDLPVVPRQHPLRRVGGFEALQQSGGEHSSAQ
jgi:hypothetical protein